MNEDVATIIQEIMDLTGDKQTALGKKLGVGQSTINRWLNRIHVPNKRQWDRIEALWRNAHGIKLSLDQKIRPYGRTTERNTVSDQPDNHTLRLLRRIDQKLDTQSLQISDLINAIYRLEADIGAIRGSVAALRHDMTVYASRWSDLEVRMRAMEEAQNNPD